MRFERSGNGWKVENDAGQASSRVLSSRGEYWYVPGIPRRFTSRAVAGRMALRADGINPDKKPRRKARAA